MVAPIIKAIFNLGKKELNQNEKQLKNIEKYEQKEKSRDELSDFRNDGALQSLSVTVNGEKYKII